MDLEVEDHCTDRARTVKPGQWTGSKPARHYQASFCSVPTAKMRFRCLSGDGELVVMLKIYQHRRLTHSMSMGFATKARGY